MHRNGKYSQFSSIILSIWPNGECLFTNEVVVGSIQVALTSLLDIAPVLSEEFLDIQANIEYGFTLKRVQDIRRRYSLMHRTDNYSQFSSIIWSL